MFLLAAMKDAILEDSIDDDDEVAMIKKVICGTGCGAGEGVERAEADFLFALDDGVAGKENIASWADLLAEDVSKHVLEDKALRWRDVRARSRWLDTSGVVGYALASVVHTNYLVVRHPSLGLLDKGMPIA